jgi:transposase-like protein
VTVRTTAKPLELERPRVRNASALGFSSAILGKGATRTHALEALVVCSFLRGLSVRDVEAALEEAFDGPVVSKSTVSRICAETRERYRARCGRRLDEHDLVYLFLDAVYLKLRPDDTPAEGVLVPGASRSRAARCCSALGSARARATRTGSSSAATSQRAVCARRH